MGVLDISTNKTGSISNRLKNPLSKSTEVPFNENDFPDGFIIKEILSNGKDGAIVYLVGNMMPKIPFTRGGSQRTKKEFYSGSNEPVIQILGSEEDDITINGRFKAKKFADPYMRSVPEQIMEQIESIRKRGNIVTIELGEFKRYCVLSKCVFDMNKLSEIDYKITFIVFGESKPTNARYLKETKEIPNALNQQLLDDAYNFEKTRSSIPASVPISIGDAINGLTGSVASALSTVTSFVDSIVSTVNDVQKSVTRAKGLIKYAQGKLNSYKKFLGSIKPFDDSQSLTGRYENSRFYNSQISYSSSVIANLEKMKRKLNSIAPNIPLGRHLVRNGDTLQKISMKFYGNADNWKKIYDYNRLESTDLSSGSIIEIPKL